MKRVALKRRKRLNSVSKTNKRWNAPGRARPDEPLAEQCEAAVPGVCSGRPTDRHHIIPRGPGSTDEAWATMDVCRCCHRHIELNRTWAKSQGFLRPRPPIPGTLPIEAARWCYIDPCGEPATLVVESHPDDVQLCDGHRHLYRPQPWDRVVQL